MVINLFICKFDERILDDKHVSVIVLGFWLHICLSKYFYYNKIGTINLELKLNLKKCQ